MTNNNSTDNSTDDSSTHASFESICEDYRGRVDRALELWLPEENTLPARLHAAMRYAALGGGKRMRPLLVYAAGAAVDCQLQRLDGPACAVELIHCYSLVHDDLPAMDDDDMRRGKPTCHKLYGDATAILAGDALQTHAFYVLAHDPMGTKDLAARLQMIEILSRAAGSRGMVGGQAIDLDAVGKQLDLPQLENMHIHKTGALIRASVLLGGLAAGADQGSLQALDNYAKAIGLAFQIQDDILDVEGSSRALGKTSGADAQRNKPTYPSLLGLGEAKQRAQELVTDAIDKLADFDAKADLLRHIARYIIERDN